MIMTQVLSLGVAHERLQGHYSRNSVSSLDQQLDFSQMLCYHPDV